MFLSIQNLYFNFSTKYENTCLLLIIRRAILILRKINVKYEFYVFYSLFQCSHNCILFENRYTLVNILYGVVLAGGRDRSLVALDQDHGL